MIRTVADFLEQLIVKEREKLPKYDEIQHPVLFGEMYEGLAKSLVEKALFDGMDLRVVSGKIRNSKGNLSCQIDCMVVLGAGEPIPYTHHYIYPVENVLMIVEVKKTLYGAQLGESMALFRQFWKEVAEACEPHVGLVKDAWRMLFRANLPARNQVDALPYHEQLIYHTIITETALPLRVVFGYDGYADEYGLREGFASHLEEIAAQPPEVRLRFNINAFPNLIVCRQASLIKLDGSPYSGTIDQNGFWLVMGSRGAEPFHILLELLWTRLAFRFNLSSDIFGEDLEMEAISPLLAAKAEKIGEAGGWKYEYIPLKKEKLAAGPDRQAWHPPSLSKAEYVIVDALCKKSEIDLTEKAFLEFIAKEGETVTSITASLNQKRLTAVVGQKLRLITDECGCVMLPDGRCVAAENKTNRLTRYALKIAEDMRRKKAKENANPKKPADSPDTEKNGTQ